MSDDPVDQVLRAALKLDALMEQLDKGEIDPIPIDQIVEDIQVQPDE